MHTARLIMMSTKSLEFRIQKTKKKECTYNIGSCATIYIAASSRIPHGVCLCCLFSSSFIIFCSYHFLVFEINYMTPHICIICFGFSKSFSQLEVRRKLVDFIGSKRKLVFTECPSMLS